MPRSPDREADRSCEASGEQGSPDWQDPLSFYCFSKFQGCLFCGIRYNDTIDTAANGIE